MQYRALFNTTMHDKAFEAILETISAPRFDPDQLNPFLICESDCTASPATIINTSNSLCCIYSWDSVGVTPEVA
jgi:hypothetical protein